MGKRVTKKKVRRAKSRAPTIASYRAKVRESEKKLSKEHTKLERVRKKMFKLFQREERHLAKIGNLRRKGANVKTVNAERDKLTAVRKKVTELSHYEASHLSNIGQHQRDISDYKFRTKHPKFFKEQWEMRQREKKQKRKK